MAADRREIPGMFEGKIFPVLVKLALPIFAGMIFQLLYNITDTLWISMIDKSDPSYVGGTGLIFPVIFFAMAIGNGIMVGVSSLVARSIGEGNHKTLEKVAESGMVIALVVGLFFVIGGFLFGNSIITLLKAEGDYFTHALEYFYYILPCAAIIFVVNVFGGILQGEGLMKHVMISMVIGTIGNIILDPIFIFVLKMDVRGAALATDIAQFIAGIYIVSVFLNEKSSIKVQWKIKNFDPLIVKEIMRIGMPQAFAQIIMSLSFLAFNTVVISIDALAITAFTLCGRFDQVVLMPIFSIGAALITMTGQNFGRGNVKRIKQIWLTAIVTAGITSAFFASLMVVIAPALYSTFSDIPAVIEYAVRQTRTVEFSLVLATVGILARSVFQGVGKAMPGVYITLLRLIGIALPVVMIFVYVLNMGIPGVWYGMVFANSLTAIISFFWVQGTLKKIQKPEPVPA